ncbi:MAG: hypothetical protein H8E39_05960 [Alphaproteobacteria bacterium]|nr:hypothetical protein [Alphaproteobacteria bacterium]
MSNIDRVSGDVDLCCVAENIIKTQRVSAAVYVEMKIKEMEEIGDKENKTYWEKILEQVEKLLYEA